MRAVGIPLAFLLSCCATALRAQCSGSPSVQDVCNRAIDAMKVFHPAAGLIVSGGNSALGSALGLGGLGHGSFALRVSAVKVIVPNPDTSFGGATVEGLLAAPEIEVGAGIARGRVAIDGLLAATLLPTTVVENLRVDSSAIRVGSVALGLGFGLRGSVGRGAFPVPAVSLSVMRRTLPRVTYGQLAASSLSSGDAYEFDTDLQATNVRLAASYRLSLFDVSAGIGFDRYTSTGGLRYYDNPPFNTIASVPFNPRTTRQLVFVNGAARLPLLTVAAELGYQTGKDQDLSASYTFDATGGHVFGGFALRLGF